MNGIASRLRFVCAALAVALIASASGARADDPVAVAPTSVQPALDGVFGAFRSRPLVGLSDHHGIAAGMDFYAAIVRDPRFARDVGNVVVEFGGAARQDVIDRYVAGERVPYADLRTVWTDTVGWIPTAGYLGFARFFAAVRDTNKRLPANRRIRVWLGEPSIDWPAATREDYMRAMGARDSHPADVILQNILARGKKALVIYGGVHFARGQSLRQRVEAASHPGAMFVVTPYSPLHQPPACAPFFARAAGAFPALAAPSGGGVPEAAMRDCATWHGGALVVDGDGVLFLGAPATLTRGPFLPDYVLDTAYRREMNRRAQLGGPPLVRFPAGLVLRKADYAVDLDAPGFREAIDAMFTAYDANGDGAVTSDEYVDPIPR